MASIGGKNHRQSYLLSVTPVTFSLTDGTNIPPPEDDLPVHDAAPPKADGGPLTSHPTTPDELAMPGAWPSDRQASQPNLARPPTDPYRPSTSQASLHPSSPDARHRRPSTATVRRLFSLGNLRSSFSSSRTSLMLPRGSNDSTFFEPSARPNLKRPASPGVASSYASTDRTEPQPRRSGNWFRRKSNLFMTNQNALAAVEEDRRPDTRDSKRSKLNGSGAPSLPEIGALGGGAALSDGDLGWDASLFQRR